MSKMAACTNTSVKGKSAARNKVQIQHNLAKATAELADRKTDGIEERLSKAWILLQQTNEHNPSYETLLTIVIKWLEANPQNRHPTPWLILHHVVSRLPLHALALLLAGSDLFEVFNRTLTQLHTADFAEDANMDSEYVTSLTNNVSFEDEHLSNPTMAALYVSSFLNTVVGLFSRLDSSPKTPMDRHNLATLRGVLRFSASVEREDLLYRIVCLLLKVQKLATQQEINGADEWMSLTSSFWNNCLVSRDSEILCRAALDAQIVLQPMRLLRDALAASVRFTRSKHAIRWQSDLDRAIISMFFLPFLNNYIEKPKLGVPEEPKKDLSPVAVLFFPPGCSWVPYDVFCLAMKTAQEHVKAGYTAQARALTWIRSCFLDCHRKVAENSVSIQSAVCLVIEMLELPGAQMLGPAIYRQIYEWYYIAPDGAWPSFDLANILFDLPDMFLVGKEGSVVVASFLDLLEKVAIERLRDERLMVESALRKMLAGFSRSWTASSFLQKCISHISSAEKVRDTEPERWDLWVRVFESVPVRIRTDVEITDIYSKCLQPQVATIGIGTFYVVVAAVIRHQRIRYIGGADTSFSVESCYVMTLDHQDYGSEPIPEFLQRYRWEIFSCLATARSAELRAAGNDYEGRLWLDNLQDLKSVLEDGSLDNMATFFAFRACAAWADPARACDRAPDIHKIQSTALTMLDAFLVRIHAYTRLWFKARSKEQVLQHLATDLEDRSKLHESLCPLYYVSTLISDNCEAAYEIGDIIRQRPHVPARQELVHAIIQDLVAAYAKVFDDDFTIPVHGQPSQRDLDKIMSWLSTKRNPTLVPCKPAPAVLFRKVDCAHIGYSSILARVKKELGELNTPRKRRNRLKQRLLDITTSEFEPLGLMELKCLIDSKTFTPSSYTEPLPNDDITLDSFHRDLCILLSKTLRFDTMLELADCVAKSLRLGAVSHTTRDCEPGESGTLAGETCRLSVVAIECTLAAVATACAHKTAGAQTTVGFGALCDIVEVILVQREYRMRLRGKMHLLMECLCSLLRTLFAAAASTSSVAVEALAHSLRRAIDNGEIPALSPSTETGASESTENGKKRKRGNDSNDQGVQPLSSPDFDMRARVERLYYHDAPLHPYYGGIKEISRFADEDDHDRGEKAIRFTSLLRRVCEPSFTTNRTKNAGIHDTMVENLRRDGGAAAFAVLVTYLQGSLQTKHGGLTLGRFDGVALDEDLETRRLPSPETAHILRQGISASVFSGVVKDSLRDFLAGSLDRDEWVLVREMFAEWNRRGGKS